MIEPPETAHHAERKPHANWFDICMAMGVLAMSAGSLFVALHTGHTMEKLVEQNARLVHAQSTPILQYSHGNTDGERPVLYFDVVNVGSGPARVVWLRINHAGRQFRTVAEWAASLGAGRGDLNIATSPISRTVLSPGEKRQLLIWSPPEGGDSLAMWNRLERARFAAKAEACFCSVFEECWISDMEGDVPRQVQSCEQPVPVERPADH